MTQAGRFSWFGGLDEALPKQVRQLAMEMLGYERSLSQGRLGRETCTLTSIQISYTSAPVFHIQPQKAAPGLALTWSHSEHDIHSVGLGRSLRDQEAHAGSLSQGRRQLQDLWTHHGLLVAGDCHAGL